MAGSSTGYGEWPNWLDTATEAPACRGRDTNLFFPTVNIKGYSQASQVTQAKAICAACPLLGPCREWALRQPLRSLQGIWGGTTVGDRERLRRKRRLK